MRLFYYAFKLAHMFDTLVLRDNGSRSDNGG